MEGKKIVNNENIKKCTSKTKFKDGIEKRSFSDATNCFNLDNKRPKVFGGKSVKYIVEKITETRNKEKNINKDPAFKSNDFHQEICMSDFFATTMDINHQPAEISNKVEDQPLPVVSNHAAENIDKSTYAPYIFRYYKERERMFSIENYLPRQPEVTKKKRATFVNYMVKLQLIFKLNQETLYLAVKLLDIYLAHRIAQEQELQLISLAAIFVAGKYEEVTPPELDECLHICEGVYHREDLLKMEIQLLEVSDFNLGIPLSYCFLHYYAIHLGVPSTLLMLACYILEMSLMDYDMIGMLDSQMAAAALLLAFKMKGMSWNDILEHHCGYKEENLLEMAAEMNRNISAPPNKNLSYIRTKYSVPNFFEVAKTPLIAFP